MTVVRSNWLVVDADAKNRIIFIEDICHLTGEMSITNDAENVCNFFRQTHGKDWRVVYKDTNQEWWEIVPVESKTGVYVRFDPWHGVVWDILKK